MLEPKLAQKLIQDIPEMREFVAFVASEALKLNDLSQITVPYIEIASEVRARRLAYDILVGILDPLLNTSSTENTENVSKEYEV